MQVSTGWTIFDNKLLTLVDNFEVAAEVIMMDEELLKLFPLPLDDSGLAYKVTIYGLEELKKAELIFASLNDIVYFIGNYLQGCNTMNDVAINYRNYCLSEDAIYNRGCLS